MKYYLFSLLLACLFLSCNTGNQSAPEYDSSISGAISYRDRSQIPPNSEIQVRLVDITEASPRLVNDTTFNSGEGSIPFAFSVLYNKEQIQEGRSYALDADITFAGVNLYYTLEPIEVFNGLNNNVAMILVKGPKPSGE